MKPVYLFILLFATLSCAKETPGSLSERVAGEYEASAMIIGETPLPLPFQSGSSGIALSIILTEITASTVDMKILLKETNGGKTSTDEEKIDNILLSGAGNVITMTANGKTIGSVEGKSLTYTAVVRELPATIKAEKK